MDVDIRDICYLIKAAESFTLTSYSN